MREATNETGLVKQIVAAVKHRYPDAWLFKVHGSPMQVAGVPDLLMVVEGLFIAAEVKHRKPGESEQHARERASVIQRRTIGWINAAGAMAGVVLSVDETFDLIDRARYKQDRLRRETVEPLLERDKR